MPKEDATQASPVAINDWKDGETETKDQVMVFLYVGKVVAVNHVCVSLRAQVVTNVTSARNALIAHIH